MRGGSAVRSRTVDGSPPGVGPPSSTRSTPYGKYVRTPEALVDGARPFGLALGAVTGAPRSSTRSRAIGWGERRTPSVPVPAVTTDGTAVTAGSTSVNAPGQ